MVVVDTNVLLNLYRYHAKTRAALFSVLDALGDRLWIPNQVLVEFWKNRDTVLEDLPRHIADTAQAVSDQCQASVQALRALANRAGMPPEWSGRLQGILESAAEKVGSAISNLGTADKTGHSRDTTSDRVLAALEQTLLGRVGQPLSEQDFEKALKEAQRRIDSKIPPGFKDKGKPAEDAAGDYLLWMQLMEESKNRKSDVLLVTGDVKEDWWLVQRGQTRGPRLELVKELRQHAGTRLFMMRPESLLRVARDVFSIAVSDESLDNVERVEQQSVEEETSQDGRLVREIRGSYDLRARNALSIHYPEAVIETADEQVIVGGSKRGPFPDVLFRHPRGTVGVEVIESVLLTMRHIPHMAELIECNQLDGLLVIGWGEADKRALARLAKLRKEYGIPVFLAAWPPNAPYAVLGDIMADFLDALGSRDEGSRGN